MCSNRKTLACIFDNQNHSIVSEAYKKSEKRPTSHQFTQIQIKFKNKFRLLTAIDEKTTFDDLKLALVISYYKKRLAKSIQNKDDQTKKFAKNYENLKKIANDDYVICETINEVDRMIDSSIKVRDALKRIQNESVFLKDMNVTHSMRLKRSLTRLTDETAKTSKTNKKQMPILNEFFIDTNDSKACAPPTYENVQPHEIDIQLKCFDNLIQQRKNYIKLLEEYLELSDQLESDLLTSNKMNQLKVPASNETELDSSDTGFSSPDDISCVDSLSDRFNEWCMAKSIPDEQKTYYKKISNFETYV